MLGVYNMKEKSNENIIEITAYDTSKACEALNSIPKYSKQREIKILRIVLPIKTAYIFDFTIKALYIVERIKLVEIPNNDRKRDTALKESKIREALNQFKGDYRSLILQVRKIEYGFRKISGDFSDGFKYKYVSLLANFLGKLSIVSEALGLTGGQFNNSVRDCLKDCASFAVFKDREESINSLFTDYMKYCKYLMNVVDNRYNVSMVKKILNEANIKKINSLNELVKDLEFMKEKSGSYQYNEVKKKLESNYTPPQGYCALHTLPAYVFVKAGGQQLILIKDILEYLNKIKSKTISTEKEYNTFKSLLEDYVPDDSNKSKRFFTLNLKVLPNLKTVQSKVNDLKEKWQDINEIYGKDKKIIECALDSLNEENNSLKSIMEKIDKIEADNIGLKSLTENVTNKMLKLDF